MTPKGDTAMPQPHTSDVREQAAVLALVAASRGNWHRTASMIAEVGSALKLLGCEWTGRETFEVAEAEELVRRVPSDAIEKYARQIEHLGTTGVKTITVLDASYPSNLREIYNLPPMLFVKGWLLPENDRAVAVVGTRSPSAQGRERARELAFELASRGITVLSGLARGIDTAAHEGALEAGGRTVAVMGTGINRIYPAENELLAQRIRESGALVSQFWPDAAPLSSNFPLRNVVMSGMSIGTVVVEASSTSGAKMQARFALEHGKRVFLLRALVMQQEWAQRYSRRPGALVVDSADRIVDLVERLLRAPEQLTLA
jgi:DNA processing protein